MTPLNQRVAARLAAARTDLDQEVVSLDQDGAHEQVDDADEMAQ